MFFYLLSVSVGNLRKQKWLFISTFIFLLFLGFFRSFEVGADNIVYSLNFSYTGMSPYTWSAFTEFESGFAWFMAFFKTYISQDYMLFMGIIFLIFMSGVYYFLKKECKYPLLALFFFVALLYYTQSFNLMRQFTALGLYCFTIPLLKEKRYVLFHILAVFLLTFFVHRSMIALIIIPICYYTRIHPLFYENNKIIYIILIVSYCCVFLSTILYSFIPQISNYFSFLGERYEGYINTASDAEVTISKFSAFLNTAMAIYIVKIMPQTMKKNIFFIYYIVGVVLSNTLGAFSDLFLRISTNFLLFRILIYSNLWYEIPEKKNRYIYRYIVIIYCLILFSNSMLKNFGHVVPYINRLC